jgi:hypothetical protein
VNQIATKGVIDLKAKYQTIYETSYGTVKADFKSPLTFEEAEKYGKDYCEKMGFKYIETVKV